MYKNIIYIYVYICLISTYNFRNDIKITKKHQNQITKTKNYSKVFLIKYLSLLVYSFFLLLLY